MVAQFRLGGYAAEIAEGLAERGEEISDDVRAAIDIWDYLRPTYDAWAALAEARPWASGMAAFPLPVPYSERLSYVREHFDAEDRDDALYLIGALEGAWLSEWHRRNAKE